MAVAPTLAANGNTGTNTTTSLSLSGVQAGDLVVFAVMSGETGTVTCTIGATAGIALDRNDNDGGSRYIRWYHKVLVSGDIFAGAVTCTPSSHSTGTVRRIWGRAFRHARGFDNSTAYYNGTGASAGSGSGTTLTVADTPLESVAIAAFNGQVTTMTLAWDGAAAVSADAVSSSALGSNPNVANTVTGYAYGATGESVTFATTGQSNSRTYSLVVYQVRPPVRDAYRAGSSSQGRQAPQTLVQSTVTVRSRYRATAATAAHLSPFARSVQHVLSGGNRSASSGRSATKSVVRVFASTGSSASGGNGPRDHVVSRLSHRAPQSASSGHAPTIRQRRSETFRATGASRGSVAPTTIAVARDLFRSVSASVGRAVPALYQIRDRFRAGSASTSVAVPQTRAVSRDQTRAAASASAGGARVVTYARAAWRTVSASLGRVLPFVAEPARLPGYRLSVGEEYRLDIVEVGAHGLVRDEEYRLNVVDDGYGY